MIVRKPFKGTWFYEWQIGALVIQVRRVRVTEDLGGGTRIRLFSIWLDPYWRRS